MANFQGRWKLVGGDNIDAYCDKLGLKPEQKERVNMWFKVEAIDNMDMSEDSFVRTSFINGEQKRQVTVKLGGVENELPKMLQPDVMLKSKFTVDDANTITGVEKGRGSDTTVKAIVNGDDMSYASTFEGVTGTMNYKRL